MSYIVVKMRGGLGNQLFQYVAGRHLASLRGAELCFDTSWYENVPRGNTPREFDLDFFRLSSSPMPKPLRLLSQYYGHRLLGRLPLKVPGLTRLGEGKDLLGDEIKSLSGSLFLDGYWQDFRVPLALGLDLDKDLLTEPRKHYSKLAVSQEMLDSNSVAIHVRRGDYVSNKSAAAVHGLCPPAYYEQAIEEMQRSIAEPQFYVFSDDLLWVRNNIACPEGTVFVEGDLALGPTRDLFLMSTCKHHIIANSSFSWWGAWLGRSSEQVVIAPSPWFRSGEEPTNLLPKHWKRIAG